MATVTISYIQAQVPIHIVFLVSNQLSIFPPYAAAVTIDTSAAAFSLHPPQWTLLRLKVRNTHTLSLLYLLWRLRMGMWHTNSTPPLLLPREKSLTGPSSILLRAYSYIYTRVLVCVWMSAVIYAYCLRKCVTASYSLTEAKLILRLKFSHCWWNSMNW